MEDKEIELILKESADKIKMKDFSERWDAISERLQLSCSDECKQPVENAVLATNSNKNFVNNALKKKWIFSICGVFLFIAVCLAIVLPSVLLRDKSKKYFSINELKHINALKSDFDNFDKSGINVIDFSKFDTNLYVLLYNFNDDLVGGSLELTDAELGFYIELVFYVDNVVSDFAVGENSKEYSVNGYKIEYNTKLNEDFYETKAKATKDNMIYELDCLCVDANIENLFDKLFG